LRKDAWEGKCELRARVVVASGPNYHRYLSIWIDNRFRIQNRRVANGILLEFCALRLFTLILPSYGGAEGEGEKCRVEQFLVVLRLVVATGWVFEHRASPCKWELHRMSF
jgi:hypothetical protein